MDFNHSDDRQMLADTLGRYLHKRYPIDTRLKIATSAQGWSAAHWTELADLGIVGALFNQTSGGFGGSGFDIAAVFEQLGRALVVEPSLGTLMAGRSLAQAGAHRALMLEAIAGVTVLVFAHEEPQSRYDLANVTLVAERDGDDWALTGVKTVVPQIEAADFIIVSGRISGNPGTKEGIGLFLIDRGASGVAIRGYPLVDGGRGGELSLERARATLIHEDGFRVVEDATAAGIVALAWEAIGIMDILKSATLDYLRTRKQFGVPIGKFQALQHRMATMALEIEQARSAAINAADALDRDRRNRDRTASAAKYTIGRVGTLVAEEAIQMHGGIGMAWETPVSHFAKRLIMIGHQLGDEDHHLARYASIERTA